MTNEPKKSTTKTDREPKSGDRVYWNGDAANPSHVFEVLEVGPPGMIRILDACEASAFGPEFDCGSRGNEITVPAALLYSLAWGWIDERDARRAYLLAEAAERLTLGKWKAQAKSDTPDDVIREERLARITSAKTMDELLAVMPHATLERYAREHGKT